MRRTGFHTVQGVHIIAVPEVFSMQHEACLLKPYLSQSYSYMGEFFTLQLFGF